MDIEISDRRIIRYIGDQKSYSVPDGVTEIDDHAFSGSDKLVSLELPDSVVSIGNYAFMNCYSLQEIRLPERVERIGTGLLQNCWKLREIAFPEGLEMLGGEMLESCHALRSVRLPDSLCQIERTAFNTCRSLRKIYISPYRMHILPAPIRNIAVLTYMGLHGGGKGTSERGPEPATDADMSRHVDDYARTKPRLLLDLAINRRDTDAVRYMLEHGITDTDTIEDYLNKSAETGRVEITALLLDYIGRGSDVKSDPVLSGDPFGW